MRPQSQPCEEGNREPARGGGGGWDLATSSCGRPASWCSGIWSRRSTRSAASGLRGSGGDTGAQFGSLGLSPLQQVQWGLPSPGGQVCSEQRNLPRADAGFPGRLRLHLPCCSWSGSQRWAAGPTACSSGFPRSAWPGSQLGTFLNGRKLGGGDQVLPREAEPGTTKASPGVSARATCSPGGRLPVFSCSYHRLDGVCGITQDCSLWLRSGLGSQEGSSTRGTGRGQEGGWEPSGREGASGEALGGARERVEEPGFLLSYSFLLVQGIEPGVLYTEPHPRPCCFSF